ncbi:MAG: hypothetical protein ACFFG0_06690 [Candidatus Thorarchaeota archaeon]
MNSLVVTIDLDWAPEPAIEETLDFLKSKNIFPTVFVTHRSPRVEASMDEIEVGLHPYFGKNSSHGTTILDVVKHVTDFPYNIPAFRCHRFGVCNLSKQALKEKGMMISSNVCTDLEVVSPFKDRFGLLEVPIFLEDGGYLWRQHLLEINQNLKNTMLGEGIKVIIIHPMHFAINTPNFAYMYNIKRSMSREKWKCMTKTTLDKLRWKGIGIRNFIIELLETADNISSLGDIAAL